MAGESGLNYNAIAFLLVLGLFLGIVAMAVPIVARRISR